MYGTCHVLPQHEWPTELQIYILALQGPDNYFVVTLTEVPVKSGGAHSKYKVY
jgi:hypothetical protein